MRQPDAHPHPPLIVNCSLPRRRFLQLSATAAAGLSLPGLLRAAQESPGPARHERQIKLGLIGCGRRGTWIGKLFSKHGGYVMHAVADYFQETADATGNILGVDASRRFSTLSGYKRVIESGIEAVALEAPPCFFPEHVRAAVAAGLHVFMAKPVAVDVPGCRLVEKAAAMAGAKKKVFLVDYQIPTDPENIRIRNLILNGAIGRILALNSHYMAGTFPDPEFTANIESRLQKLIWCNDVALGGGYHVNACIHAVDAALWLAGERPTAAAGLSRRNREKPHGDSHDFFQLTYAFESGMMLSHRGKHLNNLGTFDAVCNAQGATGHASIAYGGRVSLRGPDEAHAGEVTDLYEAGALRNIGAFHQAVLADDCSNPTVPRAIDSALTTILSREAALSGKWVTMREVLKKNTRREPNLKGLKT